MAAPAQAIHSVGCLILIVFFIYRHTQLLVDRIRESLRRSREQEECRQEDRLRTLVSLITSPVLPRWQPTGDREETLYRGNCPGIFTLLGRFAREPSIWDCDSPPAMSARLYVSVCLDGGQLASNDLRESTGEYFDHVLSVRYITYS